MVCPISSNSLGRCFPPDEYSHKNLLYLRLARWSLRYLQTVRVCMHLTASSQTISLHTPYHFIMRLVFEQTPRRFVTCDSRISRQIWRLLAQWLLTTCLHKHCGITTGVPLQSVSVVKLRTASKLPLGLSRRWWVRWGGATPGVSLVPLVTVSNCNNILTMCLSESVLTNILHSRPNSWRNQD